MSENNDGRRLDLALQLLDDLKRASKQLESMAQHIESLAGPSFERLYSESKHSIQAELDKFNSNIDNIKALNGNTTEAVNAWYGFVKAPESRGKLGFPIRYYRRKKALHKLIGKNNDAISSLAIENRFIKEKLSSWEHELDLKNRQQIMQGSEYLTYEGILKAKNQLVSELKYLLPTISGLCPVELNTANPDQVIDKITRLKEAK